MTVNTANSNTMTNNNSNSNDQVKSVSSLQSFLRKLHIHARQPQPQQQQLHDASSNDGSKTDGSKQDGSMVLSIDTKKSVMLPGNNAVATPRHTLRFNLKLLRAECIRQRRPTDERTLRLIATMFGRRLPDGKIGVYLVDLIQQARQDHAEVVQRLEADLQALSQGRSIRVAPRISRRPHRIHIPMVRIHSATLQEIELLVNVRRS